MRAASASPERPWLILPVLFAALSPLAAQTLAGLRGSVTDPSGASVPEALVQVIGPGVDKRATADSQGQYSLPGLKPGRYRVRFIAKGFAVGEKPGVEITGSTTIDFRFSIEAAAQVVNVDEEANSVSVDPAQN